MALDFGTGSGCVVAALAHKCPAARFMAVDVSAQALKVARENASRHGLAERIQFVQGSGFEALPAGMHFDLIVSNPPYIPSGDLAGLQPEVRDFEPREALDGGPDGLDFYRRFAAEAGAWLRTSGKIMLEFGDEQAPALRKIFEQQNWIVERIVEDYTQRPRILIATHG
jgi:release factor glutamine methyltransferase